MILRSNGGHSNARNEPTLASAKVDKAAISANIACPAPSPSVGFGARASTLRIEPLGAETDSDQHGQDADHQPGPACVHIARHDGGRIGQFLRYARNGAQKCTDAIVNGRLPT